METANIISSSIKVPIEPNAQLFEVGGLFIEKTVYKGATKSWFNENYPEMIINDKRITEEGWYLDNKIEGFDEGRIRTAKILEGFKEQASKSKLKTQNSLDFFF